ncbi:thyroid adenoma-associated protein homolog [Caerostris darwini]|uniref:Thyroid adenoma-associated protein homolog n=1 Tax=Caerostris darwini TaxID=1538125 RepID=A0AAV4VEZ4_9ARAC|nr:thyroid adenoma-associated protein homolog [Caerostris darwini]
MTSLDDRSFIDALFVITQKISEEKISSRVHKNLKDLYQIIQKCPEKIVNIHELPTEPQEKLFSIIQVLTSVVSNAELPAESLLLGSTCLVVLVGEAFTAEFASFFLMSLYSLVGEKTQDLKERGIHNSLEYPVTVQHIKTLVTNCTEKNGDLLQAVRNFIQDENAFQRIPTFHQITILHGILSCQRADLLAFCCRTFDDRPFLITMFYPIYQSCVTPCSNQYHAFSILVNWLKTCQRHLQELVGPQDSRYFSTGTLIVGKTLSVLESNWESPIKGVSTFVKEAYRTLIALSKAECVYLKMYDFDLVQSLLDPIMKLSWKVKGKYVVLSIVLQSIDYTEFLENNPDVPREVIFNLKANYASSAISEVYKTITESMKRTKEDVRALHSEWCRWWKEPVVAALLSNDKLLIQGVNNLILPWTLKIIPESYDLLLDIFEKLEDFAPTLMLMRMAKETGMFQVQEKEFKLIQKYLHHHNVHLRMELLSILCSSSKKSERVSENEMRLLKEFLPVNLNIDSTPFQQLLLSQMRTLLVRIRDSVVQEYRLKSKGAHPNRTSSAGNGDFQLDPAQLEFVEWLVKTCVLNTFPGSCYQRRRICLGVLTSVFDVLVASPQGNRRKEKPSKFVKEAIQVVQSQGFWKFLTDGTLLKIFPCITDCTDEIRELTYRLMETHSHWPAIYQRLPCEGVLRVAFDMCEFADHRNSEAGALLMRLIYKKLYIKDNVFTDGSQIFVLHFLLSILKMNVNGEGELDTSQNAILYTNMHGFLLALEYCLSISKEAFKSFPADQMSSVVDFVDTVLDFCVKVIRELLVQIRKGPDFADIGQFLEAVGARRESEEDALHLHRVAHKQIEIFSIGLWLKIKNCCCVLSELAACICVLDLPQNTKKNYLFKIADELANVLITCRHRGVIEGCSIALHKFCTMLLPDDAFHEEICKSLLNSVFDSLSDATSTSVTRRSAGLPSLVQAVVSSENNNLQRKLLTFTIHKLLDVLRLPLPPTLEISDKTDLPQGHAYHILKALVMESSVSQAILLHLNDIIPACIAGFSSPFWPIRNGALQLFGVLLPRICGQKKVQEDDSEHNLVSSSELFARCPTLKVYMLEELHKCVRFHRQRKLCSELVPVLSIIVKLSPPKEKDGDFVTEFKTLLFQLLDVPIWKVRDLVSSALSVMVTVSDVSEAMEELSQEQGSFNSNKVHGVLLLVQKVSKRDGFFSDTREIVKSLADLCHPLSERRCHLLLGVLLDTVSMVTKKNEDSIPTDICQTLSCLNTETVPAIGDEFLEGKIVALRLRTAERADVAEIVKQQSGKDLSVQRECLQFLTEKFHAERGGDLFHTEDRLKEWKDIAEALVPYMTKESHPSTVQEVLQFLTDLCDDSRAGSSILSPGFYESFNKTLKHHVRNEARSSVAALAFAFFSLCIRSSLAQGNGISNRDIQIFIDYLSDYCKPESGYLKKMLAVRSVNRVGPLLLPYLHQEIEEDEILFYNRRFRIMLRSVLTLLEDEDDEIRNEACVFPSTLSNKYGIPCVQFNIAAQMIYDCYFQYLEKNDFFIMDWWRRLQKPRDTISIILDSTFFVPEQVNLFEEGAINIFAEPVMNVLQERNIISKALDEMYHCDPTGWIKILKHYTQGLYSDVVKLFAVLSLMDRRPECGPFAYPVDGFLAFLKMDAQISLLVERRDLLEGRDEWTAKAAEDISVQWSKIISYFGDDLAFFLAEL